MAATAQTLSFNLDVGTGPNPSGAYAGAAGQSGYWQPIPPDTTFVAFPLTNIHGVATSATVSYTSGFEFSYNAPGTSGEDEALLDDAQGVFSNSHWTFANLRPGDYEVWSYAWAPDSPLYFKTRVAVTGSADPAQVVGGQGWSGTFVQGAHYARHQISVDASGSLEIVFSVAVSACTVNGVQVRELAPPPESYCSAGTSSHGCSATLQALGTPSASAAGGFVLSVGGVEGQRSGTLFYGASGRAAVPWGAGSSYLCLAPPIQRTGTSNTGGTSGACDGVLSLDWNAFMATNVGALGQPRGAGQVFQAQAWYRDPSAVKTSNLSQALEFTLAP